MGKITLSIFIFLISLQSMMIENSSASPNTARDQTAAARDHYWRAIGQSEKDVIAPLISPDFNGGPNWPSAHQAYRIIRRNNTTIFATDGMSDPYDLASKEGNGFGMELFIEVPNESLSKMSEVGQIPQHWAFLLLKNTAQLVAKAGGIIPSLNQYGVLSVEFPNAKAASEFTLQVPDRFFADDGAIGVLIGGPAPDFSTDIPNMPLSAVKAVPVVLVSAKELSIIRQQGASARKGLAQKLTAAGYHSVSDLNRKDMSVDSSAF
ncbi:MAG TPA: suppressor of fused domain protein [Advenella sp.]|nr:suppressor of fused domain protein [Advenella sp.]